jgi:hypothetical protein
MLDSCQCAVVFVLHACLEPPEQQRVKHLQRRDDCQPSSRKVIGSP